MRGVVGASTRCNSEMSVLAHANERQPGSGVQATLLPTPKVFSRIFDKRKNELLRVRLFPFGGDAGS